MSSTVLGRNAVTVNKKYTEYFLPTVSDGYGNKHCDDCGLNYCR
ncbi:MAG TPA: hypothetical protein OIM34_09095 [Ruminococcus bromii]|nr:hypothetical protein [Ruminococcus bromii]